MNIKNLIFLAAASLAPLPGFASIGDTFTARTEEGITVTYMVISEAYKEVQVGKGSLTSDQAINKTQKGKITIPEEVNGYTVTSIGKYAFRNCSGLTKISIPESITVIDNSAFQNCSGISEFTIPESVERIGSRAFMRCTGIDELVIPENVEYIGELAFCEDNITDFCIPDNVLEIGRKCFDECVLLSSLYIGTGLKTIPDYAFSGCTALEYIVIPDNITTMEEYILSDCKNLKGIEVHWEFPIDINTATFYYSHNTSSTYKKIFKNVPLYVPKGCKERYENAPYWQNFATIIELEKETAIKQTPNIECASQSYYTLDGKNVPSPNGLTIVKGSDKHAKKICIK